MDVATQPRDEAKELKHKAMDTMEEGRMKVNELTERVASKTPSLLFVAAALASIVLSLALQLRGKRQWSLFVGHWAPSFLLFGLYNKVSKTVGAD